MDAAAQKKGGIIIGIAALLLLTFFALQTCERKETTSWRRNFNTTSVHPYGTLIAKEILAEHFKEQDFTVLDERIAITLPKDTDGNGSYICIGEALSLRQKDIDTLLNFASEGNAVFISTYSIPYKLINEIYISSDDCGEDVYWDDYSSTNDTIISTNFVHPNLKDTASFDFKYVNRHEVRFFNWSTIANSSFCYDDSYPITIEETADYGDKTMIMLPYGDGAIYLHTNPIAFTNYYLTKERGQQYVDKVFSHLKTGPIYWDQFSNSRRSRSRNYPDEDSMDNDNLEPEDGPLDYILSQPPLAWAWYLLLCLGLLYLLFRAKRRQRMIPVLSQNRNTSLEFISTIGRLHFSGQNHKRIALQKMDLLFSYIRSNYKIPTKELDQNFVNKLSIASEIDTAHIQKILTIYTNTQSSGGVTDKTLIELHKLIHHFYKNCR